MSDSEAWVSWSVMSVGLLLGDLDYAAHLAVRRPWSDEDANQIAASLGGALGRVMHYLYSLEGAGASPSDLRAIVKRHLDGRSFALCSRRAA